MLLLFVCLSHAARLTAPVHASSVLLCAQLIWVCRGIKLEELTVHMHNRVACLSQFES
jgi:hypothetical protein